MPSPRAWTPSASAPAPRSARERVADLMRSVSLDPETMWRYPARVLRRPAPAHLHRPRAGGRSGAADLRRGHLGARRVDPGADPQPARRPAGRAQAHLPLHHARSGRGALFRRPASPSCISAASSRPGRTERIFADAAPPLYQGAARLDPLARPGAAQHQAGGAGRRALARAPATGLPLPSAMLGSGSTAAAATTRRSSPSPTASAAACWRSRIWQGSRSAHKPPADDQAAATASISSNHAASKMPVMITVSATGRLPRTS